MCFVTLAASGGFLGAAAASAGVTTTLAVDLALVGAAVSVASSVEQADAASDAADFNKESAIEQGKSARGAASRTAGKILTEGGRTASRQTAALGGTGFDVNRGGALSIINETLTRAGEDAGEAILGGSNASAAADVRAENARISGRSARNRAAGQIGGTVLSTVGSVSSTWYQFSR